jgi:hypothetical protein
LKLKDQFPKAGIQMCGDKIVISGKDGNEITLENRHPRGGKVTVSFGDEIKGGMWNDKVEEMVAAFVRAGGTKYPTLEREPPVTERVIGSTVSLAKRAERVLKEHFSANKLEGEQLQWGIKLGDVSIRVSPVTMGDARLWNIKTEQGLQLAQNIPIRDLLKELTRMKSVAVEVTSILGRWRRDGEKELQETTANKERVRIKSEKGRQAFEVRLDDKRGYPQIVTDATVANELLNKLLDLRKPT